MKLSKLADRTNGVFFSAKEIDAAHEFAVRECDAQQSPNYSVFFWCALNFAPAFSDTVIPFEMSGRHSVILNDRGGVTTVTRA